MSKTEESSEVFETLEPFSDEVSKHESEQNDNNYQHDYEDDNDGDDNNKEADDENNDQGDAPTDILNGLCRCLEEALPISFDNLGSLFDQYNNIKYDMKKLSYDMSTNLQETEMKNKEVCECIESLRNVMASPTITPRQRSFSGSAANAVSSVKRSRYADDNGNNSNTNDSSKLNKNGIASRMVNIRDDINSESHYTSSPSSSASVTIMTSVAYSSKNSTSNMMTQTAAAAAASQEV